MPWSSSRSGGNTNARGYGADHKRARAAALAQLERDGIGICCIGGEPIYPGQRLHLDHTPDRSGYRGLACASHNVRDGARRGRDRQTVTALSL
jgi:hypothetical protein